MSSPSRRAVLGFGALAGVGTVVGTAPAAVAATASPRSLALHGRGLRRLSGAATVGAVHSVRGALTDPARGVHGEVFHTGHVVAAKGGHGDDVATVESHLFVFADGTLAGSGTVTHAGRGTFVVTGGTGRFAGARGSYSTVQSADAAGGGEAEYTITLTTEI